MSTSVRNDDTDARIDQFLDLPDDHLDYQRHGEREQRHCRCRHGWRTNQSRGLSLHACSHALRGRRGHHRQPAVDLGLLTPGNDQVLRLDLHHRSRAQ